MSRLTELALSFFDLAEAEGRELRKQTREVLRGAALFFSGALLLAVGVIAACFALYSALASVIGETLAALVAAVVLCAVGFALMAMSSRRWKKQPSETLPAKRDVVTGENNEDNSNAK